MKNGPGDPSCARWILSGSRRYSGQGTISFASQEAVMPHVTLKGNPVTLAGQELSAGGQAPDFNLQNQGLEDVTLASSAGKTRIISTIPSLDTPVCHTETKRFNEEAAKLDNVEILVI